MRRKNIVHQNGSRREAGAGVRLLGTHPPEEPIDTTMNTMTTILHHAVRLAEDQVGDEVDEVVVIQEAGDLVVQWLLIPTIDSRLRLLVA